MILKTSPWGFDKIILSLIVFLSISVKGYSATNSIYGVVVDRDTNMPITGAQVAVYKLKGIWKIWTLPEKVLQSSVLTDEDGRFFIQEVKEGWVITVDPPSQCWTDYGETFDKESIGVSFEIYVISVRKRVEMEGKCAGLWDEVLDY